MFVIVGATVSIVVVLVAEPTPAKPDDVLVTPLAFTVAITVPSMADEFEALNRYGPAPEPLIRVSVQVPDPPLVPERVTSSIPNPVTDWVNVIE
jgi:hypothetical protein